MQHKKYTWPQQAVIVAVLLEPYYDNTRELPVVHQTKDIYTVYLKNEWEVCMCPFRAVLLKRGHEVHTFLLYDAYYVFSKIKARACL